MSMIETGDSFRDVVTGDSVRFWMDCYGDEWMAVNKWGFRVKCTKYNEKDNRTE